MAEFPAMPLFTDAYLSDTHPDLTLEEHGCYLLLLQAAWRRPNCDVPDDDKWFCRYLGIHGNKWRVLRARVLERFWTFDQDQGCWWQKRLRKERDFVEKTRRNRSESGAKGNRVRWKNKDIDDRKAIAPTPTPTPTPNNTITNVIATDDDFHELDVVVPAQSWLHDQPQEELKPPPSKAVDPWSQVFDAGKALLARYDIPPDRAHGMISRWRKSIPDPNNLMAIFFSAGKAERADIAAWIGGAVKTRSAGSRGSEMPEWKRYIQACGY